MLTGAPAFLPRAGLGDLVALLRDDGRRVIGPVIRDGVVDYATIEDAGELPFGWRETQAPGRYHAEPGGDRTFGFTVGASGWKRFAFPPVVPVGRAKGRGAVTEYAQVEPDATPMAFLGVRACELAALRVQDRVLREGPVIDPDYAARRDATLVIAVECTVAAATCFCTSMGTGPEVGPDDADLVLTEAADGFLVRAGSEAGRAIMERLRMRAATDGETADARAAVADVREAIGNPVETVGLPATLADRLDHPRWDDVASRCLACANCTLVCPTCFCTSATLVTDLDGLDAITERTWDSCFSNDFAKVAGGDFRSKPKDRYRQWLTHKFSSWVDQFGTFGCVGCGRCVTWCPAGIDIREELAVIAAPPPVTEPVRPPIVAAEPGDFARARVRWNEAETADTRTLRLADLPSGIASGLPGQFVMVTRPGLPAVPISVSRYDPEEGAIELTIRAAGPATATLTQLVAGDTVGLRGPLGRGWPMGIAEGRDVIVVAGGIGLSPLRQLIDELARHRERYGRIILAIGARTREDRVHVADIDAWRDAGLDVRTTVDRADAGYDGHVGLVTTLLGGSWDGTSVVAYACGPERMMEATADVLREHGVRPERLFVSLERHMECGTGLCGHCQLGPRFVCRDGPVFSLDELGDAFTREGR
jgi:NAD(P)H-flavin reductase